MEGGKRRGPVVGWSRSSTQFLLQQRAILLGRTSVKFNLRAGYFAVGHIEEQVELTQLRTEFDRQMLPVVMSSRAAPPVPKTP